MIKLQDLLCEDERIAEYGLEGYYAPFHCIIPKECIVEHLDILGCIEDTFHRILDAGGNMDDVYFILGGLKIHDEELIPIDLGYVLAGDMMYFKAADAAGRE